MNDPQKPTHPDHPAPEDKEMIQEKEIGKVRHDEPVTVKGVLRALLMANEPEQRKEIEHSDHNQDEKSDRQN